MSRRASETLGQKTSTAALADVIRMTEELIDTLKDAMQSFPRADSIRCPFHPSFRADPGENLKRSQRLAARWRDKLRTRNVALRDYFVFQNRGEILDTYPLAGFGATPNFGYGFTGSDCIVMLEREDLLLAIELNQTQTTESIERGVTESDVPEYGSDPLPEADELESRPLVTAPVAAQRLGLPLQRVYELARRKILPAVRFGRQVRFDPAVLEDFIERGGNQR